LLQHVYERGVESGAAEVIIATNEQRIADAAKLFSSACHMTSADHQSGCRAQKLYPGPLLSHKDEVPGRGLKRWRNDRVFSRILDIARWAGLLHW